ncbi:DUF885 domain-containing protein [Mesonia sp. MT50]|uniref:DUF885 domain-containing protein n=1 Tax=Mesonia profundi TaxID=3070998 RepID=A0ABU1A2B5_9FLAO|nr:DUF885 domain-containing protein [Mesonia profundi]MDQ7917817.1 DUF885 domain-containing protein [Mesonia profundi]
MKKYILILSSFVIISCQDKKSSNPKQSSLSEDKKIEQFFEKTFQEDLADSPMMQTRLGKKTDYGKWDDFSKKKYPKELEKSKVRLAFLKDSIKKSKLSEENQLSYALMKNQLKNEIADYKYRFYDYPVNQMHGYQAELPAFLINMHQIDSEEDAKAYISRLNGMKQVFEDVSEGLKIREKNGVLPPTFVFAKVLDDAQNVIKGYPFEDVKRPSTLWKDFTSKLEKLKLKKEEKASLKQEAKKAMLTHVAPGFKTLIATLQDETQRSVSDAGVWKLPKGDAYYNNRLKRMTTTNLGANEIHTIGLKEVERIHKEMEAIKEKVGFKGSLQEFFDFMRNDSQFYYEDSAEGREAYLTEAKQIINALKGRLGDLFNVLPKADIKVKAVEAFREKSAGKAFYQAPALDGSRPGIYYANLYHMKAMPNYQMEALAYHEGIPGHHMQIAISQELDSIPMFRKFNFYTAYVEGWGLYTEFLPKEIGFYKDPYSDFGRLAMELWRACRLVVDTGIHAKKWTREDAIAYYKTNTPNEEGDCKKMVERHIVMPGQATAYKIGMLKILELRRKAKKELKDKFDIRDFHDAVLSQGPLPLNYLENQIDKYIEAKK